MNEKELEEHIKKLKGIVDKLRECLLEVPCNCGEEQEHDPLNEECAMAKAEEALELYKI